MNIQANFPNNQIIKTKEDYPLSLNVIKRHLRLDNDFVDDDDYLMQLLNAATQMAENYINKSIAKTKNVLRIDDFTGDSIKIYEGNFLSVESVKNANDISIGTIHQTATHYDYFTIEWNETIASDPLTITFYTGFEDNQCPEIIKQSILIQIATLYDVGRTSLVFSGLVDMQIFEKLLNGFVSYRF